MAELLTRTATADDAEVLRELYRRSSLSNEGDRANLLASPEVLHWTGEGLAAGRTRVTTDGRDRILGFATLVSIEGGLELEDLFVDPEARRQGVGTRLVLDAVTRAASAGVPWIEVTANRHAAEFYASAGFVAVGERQTLFGQAPRLRRGVKPPSS
jgi:GNAT superfamily N-acetyltransferase